MPISIISKRTNILALIAMLTFILSACNKDEPEIKPLNESFTQYPVQADNHWSYKRIMTFETEDTIPMLPDSIISYHYVEVTGEYLLNDTLLTWEFVENITNSNQNVNIIKVYFTNEDSGLFYHANIGSSLTIPIKGGFKIKLRKNLFDNFEVLNSKLAGSIASMGYPNTKTDTVPGGDIIFYENPPVRSLKYPLFVNDIWTYRQYSFAGQISKKVLGEEMVSTEAGIFTCYKVKMIYENPTYQNIEILDYICSKGLVKREVNIANLELTDEEGNTIGIFDSHEKSILTEFKLNQGN